MHRGNRTRVPGPSPRSRSRGGGDRILDSDLRTLQQRDGVRLAFEHHQGMAGPPMGMHQQFAGLTDNCHRHGSPLGHMPGPVRADQDNTQVNAAVENGRPFDQFRPEGVGIVAVQGPGRPPVGTGSAHILGMHEVLAEVGAVVHRFNVHGGEHGRAGSELPDQLRVTLRGGGFLGNLFKCPVRTAGEGLDEETYRSTEFVLAQVKVRGEVPGLPAAAERGRIRARRKQGLGEDFTGRFYVMHHC